MVTCPSIVRAALIAALAIGGIGCRDRSRARPPAPGNRPIDFDPPAPQPPHPITEPLPPPRPPPQPVPEDPPPQPRAPPPPPPTAGCGAGAGERFSVQLVPAGDNLNIRTEPDPRAEILGTLPPDATGVIGTDERQRVGSATWRKVRCQRVTGWVNEHFLAPEGEQPQEEAAPEPEPDPPKKSKATGPDPKLW